MGMLANFSKIEINIQNGTTQKNSQRKDTRWACPLLERMNSVAKNVSSVIFCGEAFEQRVPKTALFLLFGGKAIPEWKNFKIQL